MHKVLLTRPIEQSRALAFALEKQEIPVIISPLLVISPVFVSWPDLSLYDALVVTSARAVESLATQYQRRNLSLWCVGQQTAKRAEELGFHDNYYADGNGLSLVNRLIQEADLTKKKFLYLSGNHISVDIKGLLEKNHIECDQLIIYQSAPVSCLPSLVKKELKKESIGLIPFYSRLTAETFVNFAGNYNLQGVVAVCKSQSIADIICHKLWKKIIVYEDLSDVFLKNLYAQELKNLK